MKIKLLLSKLFSGVLTLILFIGISDALNAQITVVNATGCNITVFVGQNDVTTLVPCDLCPINPPVAIPIAAGSPPQNIFGQDVCGEQFGWIGWQVNGVGFGLSQNPGLLAICVPTFNGPPCSAIIGTTAFWLGGGGSGPVTVIIF